MYDHVTNLFKSFRADFSCRAIFPGRCNRVYQVCSLNYLKHELAWNTSSSTLHVALTIMMTYWTLIHVGLCWRNDRRLLVKCTWDSNRFQWVTSMMITLGKHRHFHQNRNFQIGILQYNNSFKDILVTLHIFTEKLVCHKTMQLTIFHHFH